MDQVLDLALERGVVAGEIPHPEAGLPLPPAEGLDTNVEAH
jgi:hypothetical protein